MENVVGIVRSPDPMKVWFNVPQGLFSMLQMEFMLYSKSFLCKLMYCTVSNCLYKLYQVFKELNCLIVRYWYVPLFYRWRSSRKKYTLHLCNSLSIYAIFTSKAISSTVWVMQFFIELLEKISKNKKQLNGSHHQKANMPDVAVVTVCWAIRSASTNVEY